MSPALREELHQKDQRVKFGCAYLEEVTTFSSELHSAVLDKYNEEVEMIFAFDNLIRNVDRTGRRSNLLLGNEEIFVIDHEYSLDVNRQLMKDAEGQHWRFPYDLHVFYKFLKTRNEQIKANQFETFSIYLSTFNPEVLNSYAEQLDDFQHPIGDFEFLTEYLRYFKNNPRKFVTLLRGLLR